MTCIEAFLSRLERGRALAEMEIDPSRRIEPQIP
jgi:hypothetical protein